MVGNLAGWGTWSGICNRSYTSTCRPITNATIRDMDAYTETMMQEAILEYKSGRHKSVRACATAKGVPRSTLQYRLAGHTSRSHSHENAQILTNAEEKTLVRWLTRLTSTGFPVSPALAVEMADEIRHSWMQLSRNPTQASLHTRPIGDKWLHRFRTRHPEIRGIWTRQIDSARHKAATAEAVKPWFETVTELQLQH